MRWALRAFRESTDRPDLRAAHRNVVRHRARGIYGNLRLASLAALEEIGFAGLAVGGSQSARGEAMRTQVLDELMPHMPARNLRVGRRKI